MNKECGIIRDLIPLYIDDVCSEESREYINEHIKNCDTCSKMLEKLKCSTITDTLHSETENVVSHQAKAFKRKSFTVGLIISCILMIPILVCLIVNIASGHALDWFFIVLSSLAVFASVTVLPLMVTKDKFLWTISAFSASLILLLGVCCLYTGGDWFFIASSSSIFGLALFFLPFAVNCASLRKILKDQKSLFVFSCDTILFFLMLLSIGFHVSSIEYNIIAFSVSLPITVFIWTLFILIRYPRVNGFIKAGLCSLVSGAFIFSVESIINGLMGSPAALPLCDLLDWNYYTLDGNIKLICLISGAFLFLLFTLIGIIRQKRRSQK